MTNWCKCHCISTYIFTFRLTHTAPVTLQLTLPEHKIFTRKLRWVTAPQTTGHSMMREQQDQQGCPLHPVLLSSFAFWRILWSTCSSLAQNAVKRDILELDKASTEVLLLLQTKAQCDVLKKQRFTGAYSDLYPWPTKISGHLTSYTGSLIKTSLHPSWNV